MSSVHIEAVAEATDELVEAFERLIPQLSSSWQPMDHEEVAAVVADPASTIFIARRPEGTILGTLTLVVFAIPTGVRAWIEDVVVDEAARGLGAAKALVRAGLELAQARGALTVDLTSRPSRAAANQLYLTMGFELRETNVYRVVLEGTADA